MPHQFTHDQFANYHEAALHWFGFGFTVIPILPGRKMPAVKWDPWLQGLSRQKIARHWAEHPEHEVGFIAGNDVIVFDADTPDAVAALMATENVLGIRPNFTVKTAKGEHHYFCLAADTYAKSDSHSSKEHPERIDVKTGRTLVILPPSTGKSTTRCVARNAAELAEASQALVDAIARQNGGIEPRPPGTSLAEPTSPESTVCVACVKALLDYIDPDCGYDDWLRVLIALFYAFHGSAEGLQIADAWSSKGKKYKGYREIEYRWKSFRPDHPRPVTLGFLKKMVAANGHDWMELWVSAESPFMPVEIEGAVR